jgi:hypothetical protein
MSTKLGKRARSKQAMASAGGPVVIDGETKRDAGCTVSQFHNAMLRKYHGHETVVVPCGTCDACCRHDYIPVNPAEEPAERLAHLDLMPDPKGHLELRHRDDGACIHLGEAGCTVYEHRPSLCRLYDCRANAALGLRLKPVFGDYEPAWHFRVETTEDKILVGATNLVKYLYVQQGGDPASTDYIPYHTAHFAQAQREIRARFAVLDN